MLDVIVVGAGPAGSTVAAFLARQGFDLLLLDRANFPRDNPCGEYMSPGAYPILEALGVWPAIEASRHRRLLGMGQC
jgi:2-polyprenyl-6-methoxyphenol hydroxylase-like FAD-dependent oxidoreductase